MRLSGSNAFSISKIKLQLSLSHHNEIVEGRIASLPMVEKKIAYLQSQPMAQMQYLEDVMCMAKNSNNHYFNVQLMEKYVSVFIPNLFTF